MKRVLVVGTGTIGEPLIGLLCDFRDELNISDVDFYKRTPLRDEIAKVNSMLRRGAHLVASSPIMVDRFESMGNRASYVLPTALDNADIVIDCTPAGLENKKLYYEEMSGLESERLFIAQGSEKGFGLPYAYRINDEALSNFSSRFIQVVSCNTHNIACILDCLSQLGDVVYSDFVCMRRANDVSQDEGFISSPTVGCHTDKVCGTHHARDVRDLFLTMNRKINVFSSALKLNTQYMHTLRFAVTLKGRILRSQVTSNLDFHTMIATTEKTSTNKVFSFGRDHGYYGRIFNQTVIPLATVETFNLPNNKTLVTGFCFTPQDGNSLLSSLAATAFGTYGPDEYEGKLGFLDEMLFKQI